ncbi:MAG TPA: tRNA 2-thiouridine(34) synthase MnmA [Gammaproteobacteria bacterium]|nr:tRNA 2-thiouridine(34) synthase MnmA [Gammaproteobacteria bacterium]|tara:strand:- start:1843 stop:2952 length:1110 start_codon:yes stop_codon:yes gene_type:complete
MNNKLKASDQRVIVGMSGGVDSSVAALLCIKAGFEVEGLFMKNWEEDDGTEYCTAIEDLADARAVCNKLGIRLHEANFAAEYWDNVFSHFLDEYQAGRTPNPDVLCNKEIKFAVFAEYSKVLGADLIATGHYARIIDENGNRYLAKANDTNKDQSYFLQAVSEKQLTNVIFPLGEFTKSKVRQIAAENGLPTHGKKDSTGICFIGERRFKDFLKEYLPAKPGDIYDVNSNHLGRHEGLMYHTLGQRQGLGIGGVRGAREAPWYVVGKDLVKNQLIVGQGNHHPALFCSRLTVESPHWITHKPVIPGMYQTKIRYRQADQACQLKANGNAIEVKFSEPQRAVTPGQWACFYDGEVCLGGGIISETNASWI